MSAILNFRNWKKLYEQEESTSAISFIVTSGASAKSMSSATLNAKQGFPLKAGETSKNYIYELSLKDALTGKFSTAKIIGTVDSGEEDQISFDGTSIKKSGFFKINCTSTDLNKSIQVSGNGALVLARAADVFTNALLSLNGIIIFELSASNLYAKVYSTGSLGLSTERLAAQLNSRIGQVAVQTALPAIKKELVQSGKWTDDLALIETKYSPSILENKEKVVVEIFPTLAENTTLRAYYGKFSKEEFQKGSAARQVVPLIKSSIVDAGLTALSQYLDTYLAEKIKGVDANYISGLSAGLKKNIDSVKIKYSTALIKQRFDSSLAVENTSLSTQTFPGKVSSKNVTYKEGESNQ